MAPAKETLDREFLTIRGRLLDLAAALDRIERAGPEAMDDPRVEKIRQSLDILASTEGARAERIQLAFSLSYEENWQQS